MSVAALGFAKVEILGFSLRALTDSGMNFLLDYEGCDGSYDDNSVSCLYLLDAVSSDGRLLSQTTIELHMPQIESPRFPVSHSK